MGGQIMLVCEICGGKDIETLAWVDANTGEYKSDSGDYDEDTNWCNDCEEHVNLISEEEYLYLKNKENG